MENLVLNQRFRNSSKDINLVKYEDLWFNSVWEDSSNLQHCLTLENKKPSKPHGGHV